MSRLTLDFGNGVTAGGISDAVKIVDYSGLDFPSIEQSVVENAIQDGATLGDARASGRRLTVKLDFKRTMTRSGVTSVFRPGVEHTLSSPRGSIPYKVDAVFFDEANTTRDVCAVISMVSRLGYAQGAEQSKAPETGSGTVDSLSDVECAPRVVCTMPADADGLILTTPAGETRLVGTLLNTQDIIIDAQNYMVSAGPAETADESDTAATSLVSIGSGFDQSLTVSVAGTHRGFSFKVKETAAIARLLTVKLYAGTTAVGTPLATTTVAVTASYDGVLRANWNAAVVAGAHLVKVNLLDGTSTATLQLYAGESVQITQATDSGTAALTSEAIGADGIMQVRQTFAATAMRLTAIEYVVDSAPSKNAPMSMTVLGADGSFVADVVPSPTTVGINKVMTPTTPNLTPSDVYTIELELTASSEPIFTFGLAYGANNPYGGGAASQVYGTGLAANCDLVFKVYGHTAADNIYFISHLMVGAAEHLDWFDRSGVWPRLSPGDNYIKAATNPGATPIPLVVEWTPRLLGLVD